MRPIGQWLRLLRLLLAMLCVATPALAADEKAELLFVRRVAPLLAEKCLACHGKDEAKIKGGLDLRTHAAAMNGGDSGKPALVAGKPEQSPLYLAATRTHEAWEPMPPKEADKLSAEQLGWLREWIAAGAAWPDAARSVGIVKANADKWSAEDGVTVKTSGGLSPDWTNRRYKPDGLWAYAPLAAPAVAPLPKGGAAADARTLIRRATFDLTGLPPSPEEVEALERESIGNRQSAIANLIERLLASPHYGERMAQHWLDVARYADSAGFANDYERGNAWRYRDYVVRAFNSDKPYDQFVREQIAGDEIAPENPDALVATGFLRMGPWELTGMEVPKIARQRFLDDVVNSVGETFLAHSLQCARCHDHKFDPVPTRDYYAIQAVFATTQFAERPAPFLPLENVSGFAEQRHLEKRRAEHLAELARLDEKLLANAQAWFMQNKKDPAKWSAAVEKARATSQTKTRKEFSDIFSAARNALTRQGVPESEFPPKLVGFAPEDYGNERVARKGLERLRWEFTRYEPLALGVYAGHTPEISSVNAPLALPADRTKGELEQTCILTGGDPFSTGEKVTPGVLSIIGGEAKIPTTLAGRRRAFADWVANKSNPLTARVMVNRIWMWHFGEPLAGNPNNFGSTGKRPTDAALLDWLAAKFIESGWSVKAMHRLIMNNEAYRAGSSAQLSVLSAQSGASAVMTKLSTAPLSTEHFAFKPRRLTAEELRDAMLAATGELNRTLGGIPNRPEINLDAALQPRQVMGTFAAAWVPNPRPGQRHRRSLYALKLRGLADPAMEVFNTPSPDFSCERREASTVTPQVFSMFNGQSIHARALALAARALRDTKDAKDGRDEAAIARCFALALTRPPTGDELHTCLAHWRKLEATLPPAPPAQKPPLEIRRDAVEENTGEKFTFTERLHANADFIPDLQPADCDARTHALVDVCLVLFNSNEFAYAY